MKNLLLHKVRSFLLAHCKEHTAVVVGFSGGPDSLALVHLVIESNVFSKDAIHLAHVDHGWRPESSSQAQNLKLYAKKLGVSFHLKTLHKDCFSFGNLEDRARQERYHFFKTVATSTGTSVVLTGHQKEDQAETVLKRVLEGASLFALAGMRECQNFEGLFVLRPLLPFTKAELLLWLEGRGVQDYITDYTNLDSRFLRGRMRKEIFPFLNKEFGKQVLDSLDYLSSQVKDIASGLEVFFEHTSKDVVYGSLAVFIDSKILHAMGSLLPLFLRFFLSKRGLKPSRQVLETLSSKIASKASEGSCFCIGSYRAYVDLRGVLLMELGVEKIKRKIELSDGVDRRSGTWKDVLEGQLWVPKLPNTKQLRFISEVEEASLRSKILKKYSGMGIPQALRPLLPVLQLEDGAVLDCLSAIKYIDLKTNIDLFYKINYLY